VTTDRKIAKHSAQLKRWVRAVIRGLMFLRERPDEAADVAMKRLRLRNVTNAMLVDSECCQSCEKLCQAAQKTLKQHTRVSSRLQIHPSLTFNCGIRA
jgi:hypothetical protein